MSDRNWNRLRRSRPWPVLFAAALATAAPVTALPTGDTWIVDDDGGASVDFVDLPAAVAVAVPGDVILVRAGIYSAFDLDEGLAILGTTGARVASGSLVHDLPVNENAVLADLELADLQVLQCAGTVLVDRVDFGSSPLAACVRAEESDDVRLHACTVIGGPTQTAVQSQGSRVEIVASNLEGGAGHESTCGSLVDYRDGASGLLAEAQSRVHVAHSSVAGGDGGDSWEACINEICWNDYPGDGADAIHLVSSHAIVTGEPGDELRPGREGYAGGPWCDGFAGDALSWLAGYGATARLSGVTTMDPYGVPFQYGPSPELELPDPPDPFLELAGTPHDGGQVLLAIHGPASANVRVFVGDAIVQPGVPFLETLVTHDQAFALGFLPPEGVLVLDYALPPGMAGSALWAQAEVVLDGSTLPTNSVPLVYRSKEIGERFCSPAVANSTGAPGTMFVEGSTTVADDILLLTARQLPVQPNIGYFIMGTGSNTLVPPGSAGPICVAPGIRRFLPPVENTTELGGGFARSIGTIGPVSSEIVPGGTWSFQAWHRDSMAGVSNLTDAVRVTFD